MGLSLRACSSSSNLPPGLSMRAISLSAARGSGITHKLNVSTTQSKDADAKGSWVASACALMHSVRTSEDSL
eukprot:47202-Pelagomonas_calceolata.AAC.4